jgi:RHS repeat-associated protein
LNFLAAIFLTLLILLSAGISPAFAKVIFPQDYGGLLNEANQANQTKTYHFDQVGSTIVRTNDSGNVIGRAAYSAYGLTTFTEGDMATPFRYNGQAGVVTEKNGLLFMRARYYSPNLMRFLNADPIGFSGGSNWFAYADGNPISKSDPFGLCADGGNSSWGQPWDTRNGTQQFGLYRNASGGYTDQWGQTHASLCMSCHAPTPEAQRNMNGIMNGNVGWAITAAMVVEAFSPLVMEAGAAAVSRGLNTGMRAAANRLPSLTFRGDTRLPAEIFQNGFQARGSSTNLMAHALDNTAPPSAFIPTSRSASVAGDFAENIYTVRPRGGIDVNANLGSRSPFPNELEIAVPHTISPFDIRGVTFPQQGFSTLNPSWKP